MFDQGQKKMKSVKMSKKRANLNVNTSFSVLAGMSGNSLSVKSPLNGLGMTNITPHNN
jgi:hypothetical protein